MSTPLTLVLDFWQPWDADDPQRPATGLKPGTQVWLNDARMGPVVGFWTGETFRAYDKMPLKVTHWALLALPSEPPESDFWHRYAETPTSAPELKVWQLVWIIDKLRGVNVGYWTGHAFRDYMRTPAQVTHWAYLSMPVAPPAEIERQAS